MKRRILALALALVLLVGVSPGAWAAGEPTYYVALGDELSLQGPEGEASFPQRVALERGWELRDLARSGLTSQGLLDQLQTDPETIQSVKLADVITVTIGRNDLWDAAWEPLGNLCQADGPLASTGDLEDALADWLLPEGPDAPAQVLTRLTLLSEDLESSVLRTPLNRALNQFSDTWPQVMDLLEQYNPQAQVLAVVSYNPYSTLEAYESSEIYFSQTTGQWSDLLASAIRRSFRGLDHCVLVDCVDVRGAASVPLENLLETQIVDRDLLESVLDLTTLPGEEGLQAMAEAVIGAWKSAQLQQQGASPMVELPFYDVVPGEADYGAVQLVYSAGLMQGVSPYWFDLTGTLTRAMVVTILYRMEDAPEVEWTGAFSDVPAESWYASAVQWAYDHGIAEGQGGGLFAPDAQVTGQELAAFVYRYAELSRLDTSYDEAVLDQIQALVELQTLDTWAVNYVAWALAGGMLDLRVVRPNEPATRADAARFVAALLAG